MSNISFRKAISNAWDLMYSQLFNPFNISSWFTIGLSAWLATLGQRSGSFSFSIPTDNTQLSNISMSPEQFMQKITAFVTTHLLAISLIGSIVFIIIMCFTILILWLSSKGKFLFLHNLTHSSPEIQRPWNATRGLAKSLFHWRLLYTIINMIISILFIGTGILLLVPCLLAQQLLPGPVIGLFVLLMFILLYALIISAINMSIDDFIAPIMLKKRIFANAAWGVFFRLIRNFIWSITAYGIIKCLLIAGISIAFFTAYLMTCCFCCCGAILLSIPYISVVILLPYYVFIRHFNLCFLAQLSDDLNLYTSPEPPPYPPLPDSPKETQPDYYSDKPID